MNTRLNTGKSRILLVGGLLAVLALAVCFGMFGPKAVGAAPLGVPSGYNLVWSDEFDGPSLNTANWTIGLKDPATGDIVPGAKGQYLLNTQYASCITPEDVYIQTGSLVLRDQKRTYQCPDPAGTYQYTSATIISMHKVSFNKGYVEFRAQFPAGTKLWPALWLAPESLKWPPEIDMWEYFGYRADYGYDNMINALALGPRWTQVNWYGGPITNFNATYNNAAWHVYGFQWTTTQMIWTLDGVQKTVINKSSLPTGDQRRWINQNMYFLLNSGSRTDAPDQTNWPNYLVIDYVRLYQ